MTWTWLVVLSLSVVLAQQGTAQRRPLSTPPVTAIAHPPPTAMLRYDAAGRATEYAVNGRIDYRAATGDFQLSWTAADGHRRAVALALPTKVVPVVAAEVSYDAATRLYSYRYTVGNGSAAQQRLQSFYVQAANPSEVERPSSDWASDSLTDFLKQTYAIPDGWVWGMVHGALGVLPGRSVSGFGFRSPHPPGVVRCYAAARRDIPQDMPDLPDELYDPFWTAGYVIPQGYTIGPVPVAMPRTARGELEELTRMLELGAQQGWFEGAAAPRAREALANVTQALARADSVATRRGVARLLTDLEAPVYRDLLPEARALLRFRLPVVAGKIRS